MRKSDMDRKSDQQGERGQGFALAYEAEKGMYKPLTDKGVPVVLPLSDARVRRSECGLGGLQTELIEIPPDGPPSGRYALCARSGRGFVPYAGIHTNETTASLVESVRGEGLVLDISPFRRHGAGEAAYVQD
jgi:hypothetical protein